MTSNISSTLCTVSGTGCLKGVFQQMRCWLFSCVLLFPAATWHLVGPPRGKLTLLRVTGNAQLVIQWLPENRELLLPPIPLPLPSEYAALRSNRLYQLLGSALSSYDHLDFPGSILSCHFHSRGSRDITEASQSSETSWNQSGCISRGSPTATSWQKQAEKTVLSSPVNFESFSKDFTFLLYFPTQIF